MKRKILFVLRVALASVFIVSGFMKLMEPAQNFLAVVYEYKILSGPTARLFADSMPWFEFIFGVFLLKGLWTRFSVAALWSLNSLFIIAVGSALWRKLPITECGCFGGQASLPLERVLALDLVLWTAFAVLFLFSRHATRFSMDEYFSKRDLA